MWITRCCIGDDAFWLWTTADVLWTDGGDSAGPYTEDAERADVPDHCTEMDQRRGMHVMSDSKASRKLHDLQ